MSSRISRRMWYALLAECVVLAVLIPVQPVLEGRFYGGPLESLFAIGPLTAGIALLWIARESRLPAETVQEIASSDVREADVV